MNRADALALARGHVAAHLGPEWRVVFINTKNILGQCSSKTHEIRLSTVYVDHNEADSIEQTVLHEIAHALHGPVFKNGREKAHGPRWQRIARSIGVKAPKASKKVDMPPPRYVATCPVCAKVIGERHILLAAARTWRSRCHSATVVWTDRHSRTGTVAPAKPVARPVPRRAPVMSVAYSKMTPGQKAAYTKRLNAARAAEQWNP